jgi:activating signal cointegrator 1
MKMMAITLHQPWAMLVATGWKEVETRDWYTAYRGPLAIHAGKHFTKVQQCALDRILQECDFPLALAGQLDFGAVVAVCTLAACIHVRNVPAHPLLLKPPFTPAHGWDVEREMGDYSGDRWAWILRDVRRLTPAIPARGYRKLWGWTHRGIE